MPDNVVTIEEPVRKVLERDFAMDEQFAFARSSIVLPVGWTVEDVLKPEFWTNIAYRFKRQPVTNAPERTGAIIAVRTVDHAFYAEVYVRAVRENDLIVELVAEPRYFGPRTTKETSDNFEVRWNVGKRGYDIVRKSDNEIVGPAEKFKIKEDALAWIAEMTVKKVA